VVAELGFVNSHWTDLSPTVQILLAHSTDLDRKVGACAGA